MQKKGKLESAINIKSLVVLAILVFAFSFLTAYFESDFPITGRAVTLCPASTSGFVAVVGDSFCLNGQEWHPKGINYLMSALFHSAGWAEPATRWTTTWLDDGIYNKKPIEEDFAAIANAGFNVVNIYPASSLYDKILTDDPNNDGDYTDSKYCTRLNEVIGIAGINGLKAELTIHDCSPEYIHTQNANDIGAALDKCLGVITTCSLANNNILITYQIGAEPRIGDLAWGRIPKFIDNTDKWNEWVIERYGSLTATETNWNYFSNTDAKSVACTDCIACTDVNSRLLCPTGMSCKSYNSITGLWNCEAPAQIGQVCGINNDKICPPTDNEFCSSNPSDPARVKVNAFRRFADDFQSRAHNNVTKSIRNIDSNHLIAVEIGAGDSEFGCKNLPMYDTRATAKHLDFIQPEYGANPRDADYMGIGFNIQYANVWSPALGYKPLVYGEFGYPSVGAGNDVIKQAAAIQNYLNAMFESGVKGGYVWTYADAGRAEENNVEYGIIYDYDAYIEVSPSGPTAIDAENLKTRDAFLQLCGANTDVIFVSNTAFPDSCPPDYSWEGKFKSDGNGLSYDGAQDAWLNLCVKNERVKLGIKDADYSGELTGITTCSDIGGGLWSVSAGQFKPDITTGAEYSKGINNLGVIKQIQNGWLLFCSQDANYKLLMETNVLSGNTRTCPTGYAKYGSFRPDALPVFKPAWYTASTEMQKFDTTTRPTVNNWIIADRDKYPGEWIMYTDNVIDLGSDGRTVYDKAYKLGRTSIVITPCTNTDSEGINPTTGLPDSAYDAVLKGCVGNVLYDWSCPLKCLNSEFNSIEVCSGTSCSGGGGAWTSIKDGDIINVEYNMPIYLKASIGNIGEGAWKSSSTISNPSDLLLTGAVRLGDATNNILFGFLRQDISETAYLKDADILGLTPISMGITASQSISVQLLVEQKAWFGERIDVTLNPIPVIQPCTDVDLDGYGATGTDLSNCIDQINYDCVDNPLDPILVLGQSASEIYPTNLNDYCDCNTFDNSYDIGTTEFCDNIDNNCDGLIDENLNCGYTCIDLDFDGYGTGADLSQCAKSTTLADCKDNDAAINPGATEICDSADNNCVWGTDENPTTLCTYGTNACNPTASTTVDGCDCQTGICACTSKLADALTAKGNCDCKLEGGEVSQYIVGWTSRLVSTFDLSDAIIAWAMNSNMCI